MFPISQRTLTFREIADYWSREIKPPASHSELLDLLIRTWWSGEFREASHASRFEFLKKMLANNSRTDEPDDIFFTFEDEDEPPSVEYLQDGSALVDPRPRIPVPSRNVDSWTEATCKPAFLLLASDEVRCSEHYRYWIVAFGWFVMTYDEFMSWLHRRRFSIPTFWGGNVPNHDALPATAPPTETVLQVQKPKRARDSLDKRREDRDAVSDIAIKRPARRARGKHPEKFAKAFEAMRTDLEHGKITKQDLDDMAEKELLGKYGEPFEIRSRDTVRRARKVALSEFEAHSNSDK